MQFNVLEGALWECNTTDGNKDLDYANLWKLADFEDDSYFYLGNSDIMVVDIDLGHRIHISSFEYKFTASGVSPSTVYSGIEFYYKDESFEDYTSLTSYTSLSGIYGATISGTFSPRHLRLKHTISGTLGDTTTSGQAHWIRAYNNESIVNFGQDGTKTEENIEVARGAAADVRAIPIYNSGTSNANAYINIDPEFGNIDQVVSVSTSESGPWVYPLDENNLVADNTNFSYGVYDEVDSNTASLRLQSVDLSDGAATLKTSGTYTTRIMDVSDATYSRFVINRDVNRNRCLVVDKEDPVDTIEVRSHNAKPKPYAVFRELRNIRVDSHHYLRYRDRWLETQAIKEDSSWSLTSMYRLDGAFTDYAVYYDSLTDRWAGYYHIDGYSYDPSKLDLYTATGSSFNTYRLGYQSTNDDWMNYSWKDIKFDATGGMWIYFYCQSYHTSDFVHTTGYYLAYFTNSLSNTFKWFHGREQIAAMDVDYNNKYIWYTRPETGTIYKLSTTGDILATFTDEDVTGELGGIAVMPDGGIIYANGTDLHRLDYNGEYLSEYYVEGVAYDDARQIVLDGDGSETIWIMDGDSIGLYYLSGERAGTYSFRVVVDYPVKMTVTEDGAWVKCADLDEQGGVVMRYISKENKRVDVEYRPSYNATPGIIYKSYTHPGYTDLMPIATDNYWYALPWSKVSLDGFLTNEDRYYQLRLTFRRQEPIEKYPEFFTDPSQDYVAEDYVNQNSSTPNPLIWGDWFGKPSLDRVYVDTSGDGQIVLVNNAVGEDAYISTKTRLAGYATGNDWLEVRVGFIIGEGNGVITGKEEIIYLYVHAVTPGYEGKWLGSRLLLQPDPSASSDNTIATGTSSSSWQGSSIGSSSNFYEGDLRFLYERQYNRFYAQFRPVGGSWLTRERASIYEATWGTYFYFQIVGSSEGSPIKITYFDLVQGTAYYYTDSPRVESIYRQELVELENIAPNSYKNAYVRTFVPKDLALESGNDINMNVRWRVPTY
jgi:ribosomal protein S18 acetylase RimI-like enzyme